MGIGTLIVFLVVNIQLRLTFRSINDFRFAEPQEVQGASCRARAASPPRVRFRASTHLCLFARVFAELRHEIAIWQRAAASLSSYSRDEDSVRETLLKKARRLVLELQRKVVSGR